MERRGVSFDPYEPMILGMLHGALDNRELPSLFDYEVAPSGDLRSLILTAGDRQYEISVTRL